MRPFALIASLVLLALMMYFAATNAQIANYIYILSTLAAALIGYLIGDMAIRPRMEAAEKDLAGKDNEIVAAKQRTIEATNELAALKESVANNTIEPQVVMVEDSNNENGGIIASELNRQKALNAQLNADLMARTAEIATLQTRLERTAADHENLTEDSVISDAEYSAMKEELASLRLMVNDANSENEYLRQQLTTAEPATKTAQAEVTTQIDEKAYQISHPIYGTPEELTAVQGIGPRIEELLKGKGIKTWFDLSHSNPEALKEILDEAGEEFNHNDPTTWAEQARLLAMGEWEQLQDYMDFVKA